MSSRRTLLVTYAVLVLAVCALFAVERIAIAASPDPRANPSTP